MSPKQQGDRNKKCVPIELTKYNLSIRKSSGIVKKTKKTNACSRRTSSPKPFDAYRPSVQSCGYLAMSSGTRTVDTQCNFYILQPTTKKHKQLQVCLGVKKRNVLSQTEKANCLERSNTVGLTVGTQCSLGVRIPYHSKDKRTQTDYVENGCAIYNVEDVMLPLLPSVLLLIHSIIRENDPENLLKIEVQKNCRGEQCIALLRKDNLGLLGEDIDPLRVIITESGKCSTIIVFKPVNVVNLILNGVIDEGSLVGIIRQLVSPQFVFCSGIKDPGLKPITYPKSVSVFNHPFLRKQSADCPVWYQRKVNSTPGKYKVIQCQKCSSAQSVITLKRKRILDKILTKKSKRTKVESGNSISGLTSRSQKARQQSIKKARRFLESRVSKLEAQIAHKDFLLNLTPPSEFESAVELANREFRGELSDVIKEEETESENLKIIWDHDVQNHNQKDCYS